MKEMEVGVRNVNWMLVGAWTTGSAMYIKKVHVRQKMYVFQFYNPRVKKKVPIDLGICNAMMNSIHLFLE